MRFNFLSIRKRGWVWERIESHNRRHFPCRFTTTCTDTYMKNTLFPQRQRDASTRPLRVQKKRFEPNYRNYNFQFRSTNIKSVSIIFRSDSNGINQSAPKHFEEILVEFRDFFEFFKMHSLNSNAF